MIGHFDITTGKHESSTFGDSFSVTMQEYIAVVKKLDPSWNPGGKINDYNYTSKTTIFLK